MDVKGTAFLARKSLLVAQLGEETFESFLADMAAERPVFSEPILAVSSLDAEDWIAFNDALVDRFFDGDQQAHWRFGIASANWALTEGPYKMFFESKDVEGFLRTGPALWRAYYSEGDFEYEYDAVSGVLDAHIKGVPHHHAHFELNVMGFFKRGLELVGAEVEDHQAVKGYTNGDDEVHYRFQLAVPGGERF